MGILDEAIREHLELKRQHGAGDSELKQLEDEAFGQAERPGGAAQVDDAVAEAPTEFMTQPDVGEQPAERREPTIADLQEAPPVAPEKPAAPAEEPVADAEEPADEEPAEEEPAEEEEAPAAEEQPAMEHEIVAEPPAAAEPEPEPAPEPEAAGPSTEEREVIAEQPTVMFDIEEELAAEDTLSPTDDELVEEEIAEPRLAPTDPLAGLEADEEAEVTIQGPAPDDDEDYEDEDDAFWNEQRLSDELDQALEAPRDPEPELADEPEPESGEHEAEAPRREDDVLEETPDFLEETPEDDQLWFEQKPPKDFDFDD